MVKRPLLDLPDDRCIGSQYREPKMNAFEEALIEELEFWRRVLEDTTAPPDSAAYQRIVMAYAFAQHRARSLGLIDGNGMVRSGVE